MYNNKFYRKKEKKKKSVKRGFDNLITIKERERKKKIGAHNIQFMIKL